MIQFCVTTQYIGECFIELIYPPPKYSGCNSLFQCFEWHNLYFNMFVFFLCFRYNTVRPPNNENNCTANPNEEEFLRQVRIAQYF